VAISEKNIMNRLYLVAGGLFVFAIAVVVKLVDIQRHHLEMERVFMIEQKH